MSRLRSDESGFTLIELLAAMVIGMVVLMAAFMLLDRSASLSNEIADRQDAVQRGRLAIETISRDLRSQVCLGDASEPITYGDGDTVVFYADLGTGSLSGDSVQRRRIRYVPADKQLLEDVYEGTGVYPDLVFSETPSRTQLLLDEVDPIVDGGTPRPVLSYYGFKAGGQPGDLEQLATPLSADNASRTVMVRVGFVALPSRVDPKPRETTTFESDIYVRLADPSRPLEGPRCL